MRTIEIELYSFEELSKEAQQKAINKHVVNTDYIYEDVAKTITEFGYLFGVEYDAFNYRYHKHYWAEGMEPERLRKYILNRFGSTLYKPKFVGSLKSNDIQKHPRIKSEQLSNGNVFNPYYSAISKDTCCVLTGVCYDDSMLEPIYKFLNREDHEECDFEELMKLCFNSLKKAVKDETEALNSREYIKEELIDNEYEFTKDGEKY